MTILRRPNLWGGRGRGSLGGAGSGRPGLWTPGGGSIPPANEFAAALNSQGSPLGPDVTWDVPGDSPTGGWFAEPTIGAILSPVIVAGRVAYILANDAVLVRCEAKAQMTDSGGTLVMSIERVRAGVPTVLGFDSQTAAGPFAVYTCHVDVGGVPLKAGDIIRVVWDTSALASPGGGDNYGVNGTYLRVGAGTISMDSGLLIWVGP